MQADWLSTAARDRPGHPFLVTAEDGLAFGEAEARVRAAIGALRQAGIGPGSRVGIRAGNTVESVIAMLAVPRTGAVAVLLNTRLSPRESRALAAAAGIAVLAGPGPDLGVPVLADLDGPPSEGLPPQPERPHSVVFTSGSTGPPRGVVLTWGNLEASAAASATHLGHRPDDRWLCVLPVFHVGGLGILVRSARQATTVLLEERFDPSRSAGMLADGTATLASLVAVMLRRVLDAGPGRYRGVRAVLVGGGPTPRQLLEEAAAAGLPVLPTYGMTETASQVATAPPRPGLVARGGLVPVPGAEIRIGPGGRIEVRGPMVSPGELDGPARHPDEWYVTGDAGELDADGLRVLGRADEVIVTGGENVHPAEVEARLRTHPGVADAVVVGVPDPEWGAVVAAAYQGPAAPAEVEAHVRDGIAGYKVPRRWLRLDELPRLPLGKPDRAAVVARLTAAEPPQ